MTHGLVAVPERGRTYRAERRIRLSDRDANGRLRLDAIARYLQDVASDDVDETGWGAPAHLWVMRHLLIDVLAPPGDDDRVALTTWCSSLGTVAAGRRLSLRGDRGGHVEADSVWVHLDSEARPRRIEGFDVYAEAAGGRVASTRFELPVPATNGPRSPWPLRVADVDRMGHVNNAAYWQAVEQCLVEAHADVRRPLRARLEHRHPIDLGDPVELAVTHADGSATVGFVTGDAVKAVARVELAGDHARGLSPGR